MTTPTPTVIPVTPPRRKLVKFVRSKPGYRVSVLLNLLFLFSSLLYGIFTVISGTCIPALVKDSEEYFKFYECAGMFCFCAWNSLFMNILIIFPSVLTVHRERVSKNSIIILLIYPLYILFVSSTYPICMSYVCISSFSLYDKLELDALRFKWLFSLLHRIRRLFPPNDPIPSIRCRPRPSLRLPPLHGHF